MPTLLQVNFPMAGPWGGQMSEQFRDLAESINREPGFLWKVWIEDPAAGTSGGVYLFDTGEHARAYAAMHTERLAGFGITDVTVVLSAVNVPLSELNHAAVGGR